MSTFPECAAAMFVAGIDCEGDWRLLLQPVDSNATPSDTRKLKINFTDSKVIERCRTVELTRRRDSKHSSPHQFSYKHSPAARVQRIVRRRNDRGDFNST